MFYSNLLAVEIDEKKTCQQRHYFWGERQKSLEKKLGYEFIRVNTSKCYDKYYEVGRIPTFISKFKDRQLNKLNKKLKELEDKIKKLTGQITQ